MGTVLQCRKFNFFDVKIQADEGKLSESLKDTSIVSVCSGRGIIFLGDTKGCVHILNRHYEVTPFVAHSNLPVRIIHAIDNSSLIITVGGASNDFSEVKIWSSDRHDPQAPPSCLRTIKPDPWSGHSGSKGPGANQKSSTFASVTAVCVHPNNSLMAVGLSDGSLMLYRGDLRRERGIKARLLVTFSSGSVTNLHFRHQQSLTHLFVTTLNAVYCINCTAKDKEKTVELDSFGCSSGCSALADGRHEHHLLIARDDAIYSYTVNNRASCYVFKGKKVSLSMFKGYMVVITQQDTVLYSNATSPIDLTIYDPVNKLITLSTMVENLLGVVCEWGGLYAVTSHPSLTHLIERDLQSKFELLFKKNQFDIAINLAKTQCCNQEEVTEILKQYGDWLYGKGNYSAAMDQYIKTIPLLEPSYVIKKYLDTQHINHLTTYLQALHNGGHATSDHTTLILNCYTRLRDSEQLDEFIMKQGDIDCDVGLGMVCRNAGYYDHALALASKNSLHHLYLSILIEDKKDYVEALRYISTLSFEDACENMIRHGAALLGHVTEEATDLLVQLCTDYRPVNELLVKEGKSLDSYCKQDAPLHADPEDFEYIFVGHSDAAVSFLERVAHIKSLSTHLYTTLLGELLFQFSQAPEGQDRSTIGDKVLKMLRNDQIKIDRDHSLLLCDKHQFYAGKLVLWEQAGMFQELLAYYAENREYSNIIDVCTNHESNHPQLWVSALRLILAETSPIINNSQFLNKILLKIEGCQLLPPMELVDLLASSPHVTLGQVRDFLLRVVASQSAALSSESSLIYQQQEEASHMKNDILSLTKGSREFTGTKCNICNNNLNLPSIHFLCRHSFHVHCFDSYAGNDSDCPLCSGENKKLRDMLLAQGKNVNRLEFLQEQLERSPDSFSVVADFVGRGAFTHLQNLDNIPPIFHHIRDTDKTKIALEKSLMGSSDIRSEARLRLHEHRSQGILTAESEGRLRQATKRGEVDGLNTTESRLRASAPPTVAHVPTEARLRNEGHRRPSPTPQMPPPQTSHTRASLPVDDHRDDASKGLPQSILSSIENKASTPARDSSENPFEKQSSPTNNPFGDEFETELDVERNPFAEDYDEAKNPFSDPVEDKSLNLPVDRHQAPSKETVNPFDEDYDPKLNPFED